MKRKIVLLVVLALVLTGGTGLLGLGFQNASAATTFQKVNFVTGVVTADSLNVRQGPSTKFPVVCVLKKGQTVNVFGKLGDWYAVYEPASGCVGAVSSKYIKQQGTTTGTTTKKPTKTSAPKAPAPTPAKASPAPATAAKASPTAQAPATPVTGLNADEQLTLELINKERAKAGLEPLKIDAELQKVARLKAKDMVEKNYFSHQSPTYGSPFDMMRQFNISFRTAGENIAGNRTVEGAVQAWMNSEGHRKNILNANFNYTGIGVVESPQYGKMFVQMFIGK
ncbi:MAG TPA: CAP domain-containing protein [Acetivibrio sp.]|uniref:CAP domain-containing protein n=1 Tax=Acetivibrio sp. TaxID=1872092 RepID=UPI002C55090E|nr:CAP domain-containing protein [Acetivibrio sp.]HOM03499.1 CAP domain-containing protein [Acetivibrio sp.]